MDRESLNRSLHRLGLAEHRNFPEVFIEFELAIAVHRFGLVRVLSRMFMMWLNRFRNA
jgi:hypothetical protein